MTDHPETPEIHYTRQAADKWAQSQGLTRYGVEKSLIGATTYTVRGTFNPDVHDQLVALGYEFIPQAESAWESSGDQDAWDYYKGASETISIDRAGHVIDRQDRDLAEEAWFAAQGILVIWGNEG
jgi:hypothetical protein